MKKQKFLLNEISTLIKKLKFKNQVDFSFNSENNKKINDILFNLLQENPGLRKLYPLLTKSKSYLQYVHLKTIYLLSKSLFNKIFTQVFPSDSKKSQIDTYLRGFLNKYLLPYFDNRAVEMFEGKFPKEDLEISKDTDIELDQGKIELDPTILKKTNLYFTYIFHDMIHHFFNQSVILEKFFKYDSDDPDLSMFTFDDYKYEYIVNFIQKLSPQSLNPIGIPSLIGSFISKIEEEIENRKLNYKDFSNEKRVTKFFLDWLNKNYLEKTTTPFLKRAYVTTLNHLFSRFKNHRFFKLLSDLFKTKFEYEDIKNQGDLSSKESKLVKNMDKIKSDIRNIIETEFRSFTILTEKEANQLATLGLIYKDFNDNFENRYKSILALVLKNFSNEIQK